MRYYQIIRRLNEAAEPQSAAPVSKAQVEQVLRQNGYEDLKVQGNLIGVVTQIPDGEKKNAFRSALIKNIEELLQRELPDSKPEFSMAAKSSLGGVMFRDGSMVQVVVKDSGIQGDKSAGKGNEMEIASYMQSMIEKYGKINVTFKDPRGKVLKIKNVDQVISTGADVADRKKADIVLASSLSRLPVSIKELSAETWESADSLFGAKAREIIDSLVEQGIVNLTELEGGKGYKLSKEIVVEPTEEEAMNAIFGSDINPEGGIIIQDFQPKHFTQDSNNITVDCHAVIKNKEDIPTSHMMVWLLRNNAGRLSKSLGIRGIRPMASVLTRAIGRAGTKDVILVDKEGNVVSNPNIAGQAKPKAEKPEAGSIAATRKKR